AKGPAVSSTRLQRNAITATVSTTGRSAPAPRRNVSRYAAGISRGSGTPAILLAPGLARNWNDNRCRRAGLSNRSRASEHEEALMRTTNARLGAIALGALALACGCAANPATGQRNFMLVSEGQEQQVGDQAVPEAVKQF